MYNFALKHFASKHFNLNSTNVSLLESYYVARNDRDKKTKKQREVLDFHFLSYIRLK